MIATRWMMSPLTGTAGVLLGLGLVAIPLRKLTSSNSAPAPAVEQKKILIDEIPAVLRLRLLMPAKQIVIKTTDGKILLDAHDISPGESEHDANIPFIHGTLDLTLQADFGDAQAETAVFLTILPDGKTEQTRYAIGTDLIDESLSFEWHTH